MELGLKNRVIVLGGGAGGIGQATVEFLTEEGAIVVVADRDRADLGDKQSTGAFFASLRREYPAIHGYVSLVWHGAAEGDLTQVTEEGLHAQVHDTLYGAVWPCQAAIEWMKETGGGSIVIVSSINSVVGVGQTDYDICKAGLNQLARDIATGYASSHIRANALCPGSVDTHVWDKLRSEDPKLFQKLSSVTPDGRLTSAVETAKVIAFLLSDVSSMFNGATLIADRGWSIFPSFEPRQGSWFEMLKKRVVR